MANKKILIVDDDPVVVKALSIKLQAANFDVLTAGEGSEAVNIARTQSPDAILLDINFPNDFSSVSWDGFRIMDWLKRLQSVEQPPIFVISSGEAAKYEARVRQMGAMGYFQKPVQHEDLLAALNRVLSATPAITPV
jgi:two-component system KDP operon response regulator KdpE